MKNKAIDFTFFDAMSKNINYAIVLLDDKLNIVRYNEKFHLRFMRGEKYEKLGSVFTEEKVFFQELEKILTKMDNYKIEAKFKEKNYIITKQTITLNEEEYYILFLSREKSKTRMNRIQKTILASLAHELRTPLAAIFSHSEYIYYHLDENLEYKENAEYIYTEVQRLEKLINEMLSINQYQLGELKLDYECFDIMDLTNEIELMYSQKDDIEKYDFRIISDHYYIEADYDKLKQVFINILQNAFRHSRQKVHIYVKKVDDKLKIVFMDDGKGLTEEQAEQIFDRFYRTDSARQVTEGGSGLGLSIVREIVNLHQGIVYVSSNNENQTDFTVILPIKKE